MPSLVSPGIAVTVTDESNYAPTAAGTVAYILLATEENKAAPGGSALAAGTLKSNAGKLYTITSQRDLVNAFGTPTFKTTSSGTPINGAEQNEYGLLTAYSALGVSSTVYVQRADIDLGQLNGTTSRPLADPADGTIWLDTANTNWGVFEWSNVTMGFTKKSVTALTAAPTSTVGIAGDYAVNTGSEFNPVYYKDSSLGWIQVGGNTWNKDLSVGGYTNAPAFDDTTYTGSVWLKTTATGQGLSASVKTYNGTTGTWLPKVVNNYANVSAATKALDPTGGGINIAKGTIFAQYDTHGGTDVVTTQLWKRANTGNLTIVGSATPGTVSGSFGITYRATATSSSTTSSSISVSGNTAAALNTGLTNAGVPNGTIKFVDMTGGGVKLVNELGGDLILTDSSGAPLAALGITSATDGITAMAGHSSTLIASNWAPLTTSDYTASTTQPYADTPDTRLWYHNSPSRVDIMIHDGTSWVGYQNGGTDIRGYTLSATNPTGPIISATKPTLQTDGTALEFGDLWIDTSDLENYPKLYRYQSVDSVSQWVALDITDNVGTNGVVFADARWDTDGTTNPSQDALPAITDLLVSDYVDLDAPDPALYPKGMLLFNTRASGFNVKRFHSDYFSADAYPGQSLPDVTSAWVSVAGFQPGDTPNFGRKAQRGVILAALKAAIDGSATLREQGKAFNLIACPGYPELISNMVNLNVDRDNTAFIIGDTPLRLAATGTALQNWAQNASLAPVTGDDGLTVADPYVGMYYPSGLASDLAGNSVVVPPSFAVLRAIIKSDNVAYPWFAPAGTRRGLVDNITSIGYVDAASGDFITTGVNQGLRDVMYTNKLNPLTILPGIGLVVYGQKTLQPTASAMDRVNVVRLVNYIRKQMNLLAQPFVFEPNDVLTRNAAKTTVSSLLVDLVSKRGIYDFVVVCDSSNNTSDRIARNELYIDVAIQPEKAVEFIYIPIRLKNPGDLTLGV